MPDNAEAEAQTKTIVPKAVPDGGFMKERMPFIVATGGEFLGLYFWLVFWDQGTWTAWILATIILWVGFLTERIAVLGWVKYFHEKMQAKYGFVADGTAGNDIKEKSKFQAISHLLFICFTEITIWVAFFFAYDHYGWAVAFAILLIGEQLEHSMELGLMARRPMMEYVPTWNALKITLLEAGAGIGWFWLFRHEQAQLGGLVLFTGLIIEHVVQGNKIKVDLEEPFKEEMELRNSKASNAATDADSTDPGAEG